MRTQTINIKRSFNARFRYLQKASEKIFTIEITSPFAFFSPLITMNNRPEEVESIPKIDSIPFFVGDSPRFFPFLGARNQRLSLL